MRAAREAAKSLSSDPIDGELLLDMAERGDEQDNLFCLAVRMAAPLTQDAHQALAVDQLLLCIVVKVAGELGEDLHLAVLRKIETQGADSLLHGLGLRRAADTGHGKTDIDCRTLTGEEEVAFQIYLAVGDGDDIRGDICGDVAVKGLDYGQGGHAAAAALVAEVSRALKKTGVQIENVAGVGFTAGGALEQKAR